MKIIRIPIVILLIATMLIQITCEGSKFKSNYKLTESALKKNHKAQETQPQVAIIPDQSPSLQNRTPGMPIENKFQLVNKPPKKASLEPLNQIELNKNDIKDAQVYFQTWVKYFKYLDEKAAQKPKHFFKNPSFQEQGEIKPDKIETMIPDEKHFFAILYKDSLNILTSKDVQYYNIECFDEDS
jgi:hypothetical protein